MAGAGIEAAQVSEILRSGTLQFGEAHSSGGWYLPVQVLTVEDVLGIYEILVADFAEAEDPIAPAGVRDSGLLESAVYRQSTGFGGVMKYDHALLSAASLTFGIVCDHPFLNGNKRVALVAMLVHLDTNGYALRGVSQDELYSAMLAIADQADDSPR